MECTRACPYISHSRPKCLSERVIRRHANRGVRKSLHKTHHDAVITQLAKPVADGPIPEPQPPRFSARRRRARARFHADERQPLCARGESARKKRKVIVITFGGGARDQETFAPEGQENIPNMLRELAPQSSFFTHVT